MQNKNGEASLGAAELGHQGAPSGQSGQPVTGHPARPETAEKSIAVPRHVTQAAVGLVQPVGKIRLPGQVLGLIRVAGAQAAGVARLKRIDVETSQASGDAVQIPPAGPGGIRCRQLRVR
jgi:hypothetical protein